MALFNYATKEITLKIVYYGPGLSGKTTNLQYLHSILSPDSKGKLLSLSTESDRTLFFDFLPVELGKIREFSIRFQLYTVPGQVRYNATRKVVLKGADAVVFVADSQSEMRDQNIESLANMRENLQSNNINPDDLPVVLQYNKRDLVNIAPVGDLDRDLNTGNYPVVEASAVNGTGVEDTFKLITRLLIKDIAAKHKIEIRPAAGKESPEPEAVTASEIRQEQPDLRTAHRPAPAGERELAPQYETIEAKPEIQRTAAPAAGQEKKKEPAPPARAVVTPAFPSEKIDLIVDEIVKMHGMLIELKNSVGLLSEELKLLKTIQDKQERAGGILRELSALFENLKTKKTWFRF